MDKRTLTTAFAAFLLLGLPVADAQLNDTGWRSVSPGAYEAPMVPVRSAPVIIQPAPWRSAGPLVPVPAATQPVHRVSVAQFSPKEHPTAYWRWSPKADYHSASVMVRSPQGGGGSGTYVDLGDGKVGVLTCEHVLDGSGRLTVTFADGTSKTGKAVHDRYRGDFAFCGVEHDTIKPLKISMTPPRPGDPVEFVTYGGPARSTLRHFLGSVLETGNGRTRFKAACVNGDSGGTVLNANHEVVAVQSYGENTIGQSPEGWPIYYPSGSSDFERMVAFLGRVKTSFFGGGQVPSQGGHPLYPGAAAGGQCGPGGGGGSQVTIDYDKLAEVIFQRYGDQLKGPAGQDGQPGQPGPPGQPGIDGQSPQLDIDRLTAEVAARLPPINVNFQGRDGVVQRTEPVKLGGTINLPPVRMDIHHPGGSIYYQERALGGEPIAIELVPK